MIRFEQKGNFKKLDSFFESIKKPFKLDLLNTYGRKGVEALRIATPKDTGVTADSWNYEIIDNGTSYIIRFNNTNINDYVNVAIILQYGHATRNGGWVAGRDYINPAIQPVFDELADKAWREVVNK